MASQSQCDSSMRTVANAGLSLDMDEVNTHPSLPAVLSDLFNADIKDDSTFFGEDVGLPMQPTCPRAPASQTIVVDGTDEVPSERVILAGARTSLAAQNGTTVNVDGRLAGRALSQGDEGLHAGANVHTCDIRQLAMGGRGSEREHNGETIRAAATAIPFGDGDTESADLVNSASANRAPARPQIDIFESARDSEHDSDSAWLSRQYVSEWFSQGSIVDANSSLATLPTVDGDLAPVMLADPDGTSLADGSPHTTRSRLARESVSSSAACPSGSDGTNDTTSLASMLEDQPRRPCVWIATAIVALTIQWIPISQTRECSADWKEDGTIVGLTLVDRLVDHPRYGYIHLVQHCIYMWTAAALVAVHFDHQGRYRPESKLQRWTWYYTGLALTRATMYCSLSWVVVVCPADAVRVFVVIEKISHVFQILSYLVFNHTAVLKLRALEQTRAAKICHAMSCASAASFLPTFWLQVMSKGTSDGTFAVDPLVYTILSGLGGVLFVICSAVESLAMLRAARTVGAQSSLGSLPECQNHLALQAASWTQKTALVTAAAGATTAILAASHAYMSGLGWRLQHNLAAQAVTSSSVVLDSVFNTIAAVVLSGYVGPVVQHSQELAFAVVGAHVVAVREARVREKLQEACSKKSTVAAAIQSIVDGRDASSILQQARARFRRIHWVVLRNLRDLMAGGPIDGRVHNSDLYDYSEPCCLSECDAFLSHSWHDDFDRKWAALSKWCEEFNAVHGRYPTLWVDKFCINQRDLTADLPCLPVFLAGCNSLLIMCGHTYTERLWCSLELYVFVMMQSEGDVSRTNVQAFVLAESEETKDAITDAFISNFDANNCTCLHPEDKQQILAVIEHGEGGVEAFNVRVRQLARSLLAHSRLPAFQKLSWLIEQCRRG